MISRVVADEAYVSDSWAGLCWMCGLSDTESPLWIFTKLFIRATRSPTVSYVETYQAPKPLVRINGAMKPHIWSDPKTLFMIFLHLNLAKLVTNTLKYC